MSIGDDGLNGPDQNPANNVFTLFTPVNAAPDLVLTKSDGGVTASAGEAVVYTLYFTNTGTQGATGVVLTETLPANTTYSGSGWTLVSGSTYTQSVGSLAAGGNGHVDFVVTVNSQLPLGVVSITNTATIADDGANGADLTPGNNTASDSTPVVAMPDLRVSKTDGDVSVRPVG